MKNRMIRQVLTVDQVASLKEKGWNTQDGSMCWIRQVNGDWDLVANDAWLNRRKDFMKVVTTYTLQDIMERLPKVIWLKDGNGLSFMMDFSTNRMMYCSTSDDGRIIANYWQIIAGEDLLQAAFRTMIWCLEKGYL